jgi:O-antigen/teichoic acid export membrane protein
MSAHQRIFAALAANTFGQAVTIGTQLLLTPLFFKQWGAAMYGEWLILSSIPAYMNMADLGIGSAAGNDMTMKAGAGDRQAAQQVFRAALIVSGVAGLVVILLGVLAAVSTWSLQVPRMQHIGAAEAAWVLLVLAASVALGFVGGILGAGFRCCGRNAQGLMVGNVYRLLEAVSFGALLLADQSPIVLCLVVLAIKLVVIGVQLVWLRVVCPWLFTPAVPADMGMVRRLIGPAMGFMAFPLGHALSLQGPLWIIGATLGAPAVAVFSAMRTMARLPIQITNVFNASVWPEMSRAYGADDIAQLRLLHRLSWGSTFLLIGGAAVTLLTLGPWLAGQWLGREVQIQSEVLWGLVLITVFGAVWNVSSVVLAAINAHARLGLIYVLVNLLCLPLAYGLSLQLGWAGLLGALLLADVLVLLWLLPRVMEVTGDQLGVFFRESTIGGAQRICQLIKSGSLR